MTRAAVMAYCRTVIADTRHRRHPMKHIHDARCLDRPSLRPGRRIPILGGLEWNYFRTVEAAWGPMRSRDGLKPRLYLSLGHLTLWLGRW